MQQPEENFTWTDNVPESTKRIRKIKPIFLNVNRKTWNLFKKISDRSGVTLSSMASEAVLEWIQKNRDLVTEGEKKTAADHMQELRDIRRMKRLCASKSPLRWARVYPGRPYPGNLAR